MTDLLTGNPKIQPVYEVIKREDLAGAFRDALEPFQNALILQLEDVMILYSAIVPNALWTWDFSSRWDFDMWW